ncbi:hypothetical protein [Vallitalea okinawensis]|uniref:hypothetical protein n=1 Tax=Vallitalea okinawensis TaxID=2078660 RepID=UPI000CFC7FA9|nr:hypothetical protein [Vallitalea okinawensis]
MKVKIILMLLLISTIVSGCSRIMRKDTSKGEVEPITLFEYNNAYYEYLDDEYLEVHDIYREITQEDLGDEIYEIPSGTIGHDSAYDHSKVYEYKAFNSNAIVVVDKKGLYQVFGFCNFIDDQPNDAKRILEVYNVTSPEDIVCIEEFSPYAVNKIGITVPQTVNIFKDKEYIEHFYSEYKDMKDVGSDQYEEDAFGDVTEEQWQNGYDAYLEGQRDFYLNLTNGLRIKLSFYPEIGYMDGYLAHYKITEEFSEFLSNKTSH